MNFFELFIIANGVSMDAFAASICKGLSLKKFNFKMAIIVGLFFGIFQAVMPLIGYFLGIQFKNQITSIDHWIAFFLLVIIGINMIRESRKGMNDGKRENKHQEQSLINYREMFILAFSTSIDALAVGVSFAFLNVQIVPAVIFIGIVTFLMSIIGVKVGNVFGTKYKSKAELTGGIILILMGFNILLEHLHIINF